MLSVEDISFSYFANKTRPWILKDFSADFSPGFNVLVGPNGAGKSTLLKCLFGLLKSDGNVEYQEKKLSEMSLVERADIMSYLPQMDTAGNTLRVLETVLLGRLPNLKRVVTDEDLEIVMQVLERLDIQDFALRRTSQLSGGQQKMVYIAQTLVRDPKIILMDEPFGALDLKRQLEICDLLKNISHQQQIIVIVVLHDINIAARYADHVVVMNPDGSMYSQGKAEDTITPKMLREVYEVHAHFAYDEDGIPIISPISSI